MEQCSRWLSYGAVEECQQSSCTATLRTASPTRLGQGRARRTSSSPAAHPERTSDPQAARAPDRGATHARGATTAPNNPNDQPTTQNDPEPKQTDGQTDKLNWQTLPAAKLLPFSSARNHPADGRGGREEAVGRGVGRTGQEG